MKLATLRSPNHLDGMLCVVNQDLTRAVHAAPIVQTLQGALERWKQLEKPLRLLSEQLEKNQLKHAFPLNLKALDAPLPRAYQWLDGSVYLNHVELVRKSRGVELPADAHTNPLMYQGGSAPFLGPYDPIPAYGQDDGLDFEGEVAIITDDVPMGITPKEATAHIKLIMLVNDISLRQVALKELQKGFGFIQSKPPTSFSPIALTPDALGDAWKEDKLHLPLCSFRNDKPFGTPNAGVDMAFSFAELISHAAKTRPLPAGTIIGSGTVSNRDRSCGSSCIVEQRTIETIEKGKPQTPYLEAGETVRIEMYSEKKENLFGSIIQTVQA